MADELVLGVTGAEEPRPPTCRDGLASLNRWALAAIALPSTGYGLLAWSHRWTSDDGFIFFRVVAQVIRGNGPVFNGGERVEAATSPLWVGVLTLSRFLLPDGLALEWIAAVLSLSAAVFGLTAASLGALAVVRRSRPSARFIVPFGSLVVVAVAPFWDFATSGLEMGLVFGWLGGSFWASTAFASRVVKTGRIRWWLAILFGLGPLIRPDLVVFAAAFLAAQAALDRGTSWRRRLGVIATGVALPAVYEVFRMGYYVTLVPNSALAKSADASNWARGLKYLASFVSSSVLELPLLLIGGALVLTVARLWRGRQHEFAIVCSAPVLAALVHALYVIRVGGDFFLGRLLLPAVFAIAMPVAVVALSDTAVIAGFVVLGAWAIFCGSVLRPNHGDQRAFYIGLTGHAHPVTINDYRSSIWVRATRFVDRSARQGNRVLDVPVVGSFFRGANGKFILDVPRRLALAPTIRARAGFAYTAVGAVGYELGPDVFVVDRLGLGDPIGSRLTGFPSDLPVGHERYMSIPWVEARAADPTANDPDHDRQTFREIASRALQCGDASRLLRDIRSPLTLSRFVSNLSDAPRLTRLRISQNPFLAASALCPH